MKMKMAIFEEDIKAEVLINKRVSFGLLDNYINLYKKMLEQGYKKEVENYDLVFSIVLNHFLKQSKPLIIKHSNDLVNDLKIQFNRLVAIKDLFIFETIGISNADYFIQNTSEEKEYRTNIPIASIIKILDITDKYFGIQPRYNEDSLRRYINIYDLISLNHKAINRELLNYDELELNINFNAYILKVES